MLGALVLGALVLGVAWGLPEAPEAVWEPLEVPEGAWEELVAGSRRLVLPSEPVRLCHA